MSRIRVVHRTGYTYAQGAHDSMNHVRMTPASTHEQLVLSTQVEISPTAWTNSYVDYWGTRVLAFEVHERHEHLRITASSEVDVHRSMEAHEPVLGWDDLADPALCDRLCEYLEATELTVVDDEMRAAAAGLREAAESPSAFVSDVVELVRGRVSLKRGAGARTPAPEVWTNGTGSFQDMAHVVIGLLRSQLVPARYVSGYVLPEMDPPLGVPQLGSLHAWVQYWDGQWAGIDLMGGYAPGEGHIEVGYGRDHRDVPALTGIFTGGKTSEIFVEVELTRVG